MVDQKKYYILLSNGSISGPENAAVSIVFSFVLIQPYAN